MQIATCAQLVDDATPAVEVTNDVAHVFFWCDNFNLFKLAELEGIQGCLEPLER